MVVQASSLPNHKDPRPQAMALLWPSPSACMPGINISCSDHPSNNGDAAHNIMSWGQILLCCCQGSKAAFSVALPPPVTH